MTDWSPVSIWPEDVRGMARPKIPAIMTLDPIRLRQTIDTELSEQQKRVLLLLSEGHANKAIAWVLGVEEATAKAHVSSILKKVGLTNRTQAALLGLRVRLLVDDAATSTRATAISAAAHSAHAAGYPMTA